MSDYLSEILQRAASGQERSELLAEQDHELLRSVESVGAWLDAATHISVTDRAQLAMISRDLKKSTERRLGLLRSESETVAAMVPAMTDGPADFRAHLLRTHSAIFEAMASTAALCAATITTMTAIDQRLAQAEEQ